MLIFLSLKKNNSNFVTNINFFNFQRQFTWNKYNINTHFIIAT